MTGWLPRKGSLFFRGEFDGNVAFDSSPGTFYGGSTVAKKKKAAKKKTAKKKAAKKTTAKKAAKKKGRKKAKKKTKKA